MDAQQLMAIYPHATVQSAPALSDHTVCVKLAAGKYLCIDTTNLEDRELALLELLATPKASVQTDDWTAYLLGKTAHAPQTTAEQFQLVYFRVRFTDATQSRTAWLQAFAALFDGCLHQAWTAKTAGYLLLKQPVSAETDLPAMLALLDDDFATNTTVLLGSQQPHDAKLPRVYTVEQQLFSQEHQQAVTTVTAQLLPALAGPRKLELRALCTPLLRVPENQQLIRALYQTLGNVRQAAAHLFVHRNTLLYRIDKFERASGFDLKNMDDLIYCYLLVLAAPST
ncbi:helix-turn-helix domain-containing protein [Lactiplantibacillus plajomi]|uniref:Helix-turn-helix domain-containing protein n=1 Tax=Lactiplantibacillus plajomi TaxID=1457217 RepID=A0ABV6K4G3_9LACO|nr:helix-turn-helix domain-containing protein [Lactiplantibacillus plajomi]